MSTLLLVVCMFGLVAVAVWGIAATALERERHYDDRRRRARLIAELERYDRARRDLLDHE